MQQVIIRFHDTVTTEDMQRVVAEHGLTWLKETPRLHLVLCTAPEGQAAALATAVSADPLVRYAEASTPARPDTVNDPFYQDGSQWGLPMTRAAHAWGVETGDPDVLIAILDFGFDLAHVDLQGKIVDSFDPTGFGIASPDDDHGTFAAGVAAAATNNGAGVAAVGYNCRLLVARIEHSGHVVDAIEWAVQQGASIISMSFSFQEQFVQSVADEINAAYNAGVLCISSAGNNSNEMETFPANMDTCMAVASTDSNDNLAGHSTFGSWVDIAAPGEAIRGLAFGNRYRLWSGTSFAAPYVAGAAGLVFSRGLTNVDQVWDALVSSTVGDFPVRSGSGRIDVYNAVKLADVRLRLNEGNTFRPDQCSAETDLRIHDAVARYNLPRWFYYAIVEIESSFNPNAVGPASFDYGLTQLNGAKHAGEPYPFFLEQPSNSHQQWIWDMGIDQFGEWIRMTDVNRMDDAFDRAGNLSRFATAHAVAGFWWMKVHYPSIANDDVECLRAVAYHWNQGYFNNYLDNQNHSYLTSGNFSYDGRVDGANYRSIVESEDGVWDGIPHHADGSMPPHGPEEEEPDPPPPPPPPPGEVVLSLTVTGQGDTQPPAGTHTYEEGTTVDLTATAAAGWEFDRWEGNVASPTSAQTTITMNEDEDVEAVFEEDDPDDPDPPDPPPPPPPAPPLPPIDPDNWGDEHLGVIEYVHARVGNDGQEFWEVRGGTLMSRRIVEPPDGETHFELTGPAESVMHELVHSQFSGILRGSDEDITFNPDQQRGREVTLRARYDNLLDKLAEVGRMADMGWELLPGGNSFIFTAIPGRNRSVAQEFNNPVMFSPDRGNVAWQEFIWSVLDWKGTAYVAGQGTGVDRTVVITHQSPQDTVNLDVQGALIIDGGRENRVEFPPGFGVRGLDEVTVEGWVLIGPQLELGITLYREATSGSALDRFALRINPDGNVVLSVRPNDLEPPQTQHFLTTTVVPDDVWVWIAAQLTFPGNGVRIRIWSPDGNVDETETFSIADDGPFPDTEPSFVRVGGDDAWCMVSNWRLWGQFASTGLLDEYRVDPSLMSAPAIRHNWRCDDGAGTWVRDYAGKRDGFVHGRAQWGDGPFSEFPPLRGLDRNEMFVDARDLQLENSLRQRGRAALRERGVKALFEVDIHPTGPYRYRLHWDLGDRVTVMNEDWGIAAHVRIVEVRVEMEGHELPDLRVTFGSPVIEFHNQVGRGMRALTPPTRE